MSHIDLDISYLSTYTINKDTKYTYVRDKELVRHQFVEMILRIGKE